MKVVVQRVRSASVIVDDKVVGAIDAGLLLLVGFGKGDTAELLMPVAKKLCELRLFPHPTEAKKHFHLSVLDTATEILAVSQFTLYGDLEHGRRPELFGALEPTLARELYDKFLEALRSCGVKKVASGVFQAQMLVRSENDGPVTFILER